MLVIGDVMIDAYYWGNVDRISPEAPVPVVNVTRKEDRLGGAANVALNLISLGAETIICSVIGADRRGEELTELMQQTGLNTGGIVFSGDRVTTVKTRIISQHQQMLRVDEEQTGDISRQEELQLLERISDFITTGKIDVVIFEDYNKGVLTENLIKQVIEMANKNDVPTCVDPKKRNFFSYVAVTLFKPNLKELKEGLKIDINKNKDEEIRSAVKQLEDKLSQKISLITLSERGIYIRSKSADAIFPAHIRNIADVSGAGDTVIAVAALCLASGCEEELLARLSNLAGGLVCEKVGVVPIDIDTLRKEANKEFNTAC